MGLRIHANFERAHIDALKEIFGMTILFVG